MVARNPVSVPGIFPQGYLQIRGEQFRLDQPAGANGWGYLPSAHPGYRAFVRAERELIRDRLRGSKDTLVDVSAGVGNYSIYLAQFFRRVIHCELHVPSLASAIRSAMGKANIFFVRSDYMALPVKDSSTDAVVCTDTLERGPEHEKWLLNEIIRIMKPGGVATIDFHNDRFGRAVKRSKDVVFYDLARFEDLLRDVGFSQYAVMPIGYVPTRCVPHEGTYHSLDRVFRLFAPPSRYLLTLYKPKADE
jgi:SAM-dependent methyltransferase